MRNFCDINLQVDGLKECLSHKATARRVEGVEGWGLGELCVLPEWKSLEGVKMNILNETISF